MPLGTNHQTKTTHDIFLPERWSPRAQRAREAALHLAAFIYRRDEEMRGYGDVLNTQTITNLSANDKAAGGQVTLQTPTETNLALTINKHKEASFLVEKILDVQTMINLQREYTEKGAYALGSVIDTDPFALVSSLTTTPIGTYATAITQAIVASAWSGLSVNNVPEQDRAWFFYPTAYSDLLQISAFTSIDFRDAIGRVSGGGMNGLQVGWMYGSPVKISTNVPTGSSGSPAVEGRQNLYAHKEAFQAAIQSPIANDTDYILEYLGWLTVLDVIYGVGLYRGDHGIVIRR